MGVLPIVLLILAMKIPILGLIWFTWWAGRAPEENDAPAETVARKPRPRMPEPPLLRGPRRRGPHGGAAVRPLSKRRPVPVACQAREAHQAPRHEHSGSA
jgi:hypothetical protein